MKSYKSIYVLCSVFLTLCAHATHKRDGYKWTLCTFAPNGQRLEIQHGGQNTTSSSVRSRRANSLSGFHGTSWFLPHIQTDALPSQSPQSVSSENYVVSEQGNNIENGSSAHVPQGAPSVSNAPVDSVSHCNIHEIKEDLEKHNLLREKSAYVQPIVNAIVQGLGDSRFHDLYALCLDAVHQGRLSMDTVLNGFYYASSHHGISEPAYDAQLTEDQVQEYERMKILKDACGLLGTNEAHKPSLLSEYGAGTPVQQRLMYDTAMNMIANLDHDAINNFYHTTFTRIVPADTLVHAMHAYASTYGATPEQCFTSRQKMAYDNAFRVYLRMFDRYPHVSLHNTNSNTQS